ncbi:MAG: AMP-binding protein, partial [Pseudomonadota bacterium]
MIDFDGIQTIADFARQQARVRGDSVALWFENKETTFAKLDANSNRIANALIAADVKPGDRVSYLGKNLDKYYEIMLGAAKARAALAAINNRLAAPEMQFIAGDAKSKILFVAQDFYEIAEEVSDDLPDLKGIIAIDGGHSSWPSYEDVRAKFPDTDPKLDEQPDDDIIQ